MVEGNFNITCSSQKLKALRIYSDVHVRNLEGKILPKSKDRKMSHLTPKDTVLFIGIGINSNNYNHLLSSCVCNESFSFNLVIKCIE